MADNQKRPIRDTLRELDNPIEERNVTLLSYFGIIVP